MIVPSIDISHGAAVQLVGGEQQAIDAGDPRPIMERFSIVGEVAVIDIDAARGDGSNSELIGELCKLGAVRVGGGIRDAATARRWLDAGARKVIIGTAASPQLLAQLPRDRVIVALDSRDGRVLSHGWRRETDADLLPRIEQLRDLCGGFLITFVEREGLLKGTDLGRAAEVCDVAGSTPVTIAGGITTPSEIRSLDELGADAQVGMALYANEMTLAAAFAAPLHSDRVDGLWPTVVVDEGGIALGLAWSDPQSLHRAIEQRAGVYRSRSRGLWKKGETSGATQQLLRVDVDCDRDTLRFTVRQHQGFCHLGTRDCWGDDHGLGRLARRLGEISERRIPGNTIRLLDDQALLGSKLREEAAELAEASSKGEITAEAADLLYFTLVKITGAGVTLEEVTGELDRREFVTQRRPMERKG
ncbi:MAG: hypothetical protein BMS9Abin07_1347 [Acidimicrobiia bacterium]|nr:MAG: hypothetical protein BMS9Abin07_1347 [Acidimicrobiia bacterium]